MHQLWGGILAVTGFISCPCHLPLTLPLLVSVLGGTGAGGLIAANTGLVYGVATAYFIVALGAGLYLLDRRRRAREGAHCQIEAGTKTTQEEEVSSWPTSNKWS